jgi:hypothetical protein
VVREDDVQQPVEVLLGDPERELCAGVPAPQTFEEGRDEDAVERRRGTLHGVHPRDDAREVPCFHGRRGSGRTSSGFPGCMTGT